MAKSLYIQVGEVRGKPIPGMVSFTHQYTPPTETLKHSRGSLYTIIEILDTDSSQGVKLENDIYQAFQSTYYSATSGSVLSALESGYEGIKKLLLEKERTTGKPIKFEIIAAVLWGEALYLVKTQHTGVVFQRGEVAKELQFNKTASGAVKNGDNICLVNKNFLEKINTSDLIAPLKSEDFQEALKSLDSIVSTNDGAEAMVLRIYIEEPKEQQLEMVEIDSKSSVGMGSLLSNIKEQFSENLPVFSSKIGVYFSQFWSYLKQGVFIVLNKIVEPWRPRLPGDIEDPSKRRRAKVIQVVVVMVILLSLSLGIALVNRANSAKTADFNEKVQSVEEKLTEAKNLATISPERSKELLLEVGQVITEAQSLGISSAKLDELTALYNTLQEEIRKVYEVSLEEFYSSENLSIGGLVQTANHFIILDKNGPKIISINKKSRVEKELFSKEVNLISESGGNIYVQSSLGVEKIDTATPNVTKILDASSDWGNLVSSGTYRGNLYLLDSEKKEVWKHVAVGGGLARAQKYFKDTNNIGEPLAMAVDGAIWVGNKDGALFRFLAGKKEKFEIDGLDKPFGEIRDIYTEEGSNTLFILDKGNKRVVLLDKSGKYLSQYTSDQFGSAVDLLANESNKTIFIGVGNSIKSFKYQ